MKTMYKRIGMGAALALALTTTTTVRANDEVDFSGGVLGFSFPGNVLSFTGGSTINSTTLGGNIVGADFFVGGAYTIGADTTSGGVTQAPITGTGTFQLYNTLSGLLQGSVAWMTLCKRAAADHTIMW